MKRFGLTAVLILALLFAYGCGAQAPAVVESESTAPAPNLIGASPSGAALVGRDVTVMLKFDTAMDETSLARSAVFAPEAPFEVVMRDTEAEFRPRSLLQGGTQYLFTLSEGAESEEGASLEEAVSVTFQTNEDGMTLQIPALGFTDPLLEGSTADEVAAAMGNGVGFFPGKGRPGNGNIVVMAHASGQVEFPYNRLFELEPGDDLYLYYGGQTWRYRMSAGFVVYQDELWILEDTEYPTLTFFICSAPDGRPSPTFHPEYRYVVRAELEKTGS